MRKVILGLVTFLGVAMTVSPVRAQTLSAFGMPSGGASTLGTSGAQSIVNTPITNSVNSAFPGTQSTGFLSTFFSGFKMPSSVFSFGQSNYPSPSAFASTSYQNGVPRPFVPVNNVPRYLLPDGYTPSLASGR